MSPHDRHALFSRRAVLATLGSMAGTFARAKLLFAERGYEERFAEIQANRQAVGERNRSLSQRKFSIRVVNDHSSPIILGVFGMHGRNLRPGMQYRAIVSGNGGTHVSPRDIDGGHRIAIAWDKYSEAIVGFAPAVIDGDVTFRFDEGGQLGVIKTGRLDPTVDWRGGIPIGTRREFADMQKSLQRLREQNLRARDGLFKITVSNQSQWPVRFGIFGMHGRNLDTGMQYRVDLAKIGGTHVSPKDIDGGHRMVVAWDQYSEQIIDFASLLVN